MQELKEIHLEHPGYQNTQELDPVIASAQKDEAEEHLDRSVTPQEQSSLIYGLLPGGSEWYEALVEDLDQASGQPRCRVKDQGEEGSLALQGTRARVVG